MSSESDISNSSTPSPKSSSSNSQRMSNPKSSLMRIVKAQVTLLLTNLKNDNFLKISGEINSLIETHGEDIRQHLMSFILKRNKEDNTTDTTSPQFRFLKEITACTTDKKKSYSLVSFGESLQQFCETFSTTNVEHLLSQLEFDAFDTFALSSLLIVKAKADIVPEAKKLAKLHIGAATEILSRLEEVPKPVLAWIASAVEQTKEEMLFTENESEALNAAMSRLSVNKSLLSEMMLEAGYDCCSSVASVRELLVKFGRTAEERDVAEALGCMARSYINKHGVGNESATESSWNVENFTNAIKESAPGLDWIKVVEQLDYEHFVLEDAKGLEVLVRAWKASPKDGEPFPASKFFGRWKNFKGQISALIQMVNIPIDVLDLPACSKKKVIDLKAIPDTNRASKETAEKMMTSQLNSLDLFECVLNLAHTDVHDDVKKFLETMVKKSPELVFLALVQVESTNRELRDKLLAIYLDGKGDGTFPLVEIRFGMHDKDTQFLTRILELLNELQSLDRVLDSHSDFTIDVAVLAWRRGLLNFSSWMEAKLTADRGSFANACLGFLRRKIENAKSSRKSMSSDQNAMNQTISEEVLGLVLRSLAECRLSLNDPVQLESVLSDCWQVYPNWMDSMDMSDKIGQNSMDAETYKKMIEEEATSHYERLYSGEIRTDNMVTDLKKLSLSSNARDQAMFECMIRNLLDEYQYFDKYPDKELAITSELFGRLIQHQIIPFDIPSVARDCIMDALSCPPRTKKFRFGELALCQFSSRLSEWPSYCQSLLQIPTLQGEPRHMIELALKQQHLPQDEGIVLANTSARPLADSSSRTPAPEPFLALQAPEMPQTEQPVLYETPVGAIQDKILFIINNLAKNNMDSKISELRTLLKSPAYQWFSDYLVVKRASIEPNYHELYLLLLDSLNNKLLYQHVLRETYKNIKILLNSAKTIAESSERKLLKNLGSWLGGVTLARNQPIKHKNIAFKDLLLEGYDTDRLVIVIPFVCKVLEQCTKSKVFKPPNPWLMAILKLLVELYQSANLKLNLKFEIEVLCKAFNIELDDIDPTSILKERQPRDRLQKQVHAAAVHRVTGPPPFGIANTKMYTPEMEHAQHLKGDDEAILLSRLRPSIKLDPSISLYTEQPESQLWVLKSVAESIREVIEPVVDRSVAIAVVSTVDLVIKDYAAEPDKKKIREAAQSMAQGLTQQLAMVTCKEPLRLSMMTNLEKYCKANGRMDDMALQFRLAAVADNLDFACTCVENAAIEKATKEVSIAVENALANREKHPGPRYPENIPPLLLRVQHRVYEGFTGMHRNPMSMNPPSEAARMSHVARHETGLQYGAGGNAVAADNTAAYAGGLDGKAFEVGDQCMRYIMLLAGLAQQGPEALLPSDIKNIAEYILRSAIDLRSKDEIAIECATLVIRLLVKCTTPFEKNLYRVILNHLRSVSSYVSERVDRFLMDQQEDMHYQMVDRMNGSPAMMRSVEAAPMGHMRNHTVARPEETDLTKRIEAWFEQWERLCIDPPTNELRADQLRFLTELDQIISKDENLSSLFFRVCVEKSVEFASVVMVKHPRESRALAYKFIDAFSRLVIGLMTITPLDASNGQTKVAMFERVLSVIALVLAEYHESGQDKFDQRPFLRLMSMLLNDVNGAERTSPGLQDSILTVTRNTLLAVQPSYFPGFTFAWLLLISHRFFMPKLLLKENERGWPIFQPLLVCLFKFLGPFLSDVPELNVAMRQLYRGTLRVLLVLLHDFPEFLCNYHYSFCDVIPPSCVHLRNIILSAFPRNMRLPDPFTPNLKVDLLPEINQSPRVLSDYIGHLKTNNLKQEIDMFLEMQQPADFLTRLPLKLRAGTANETQYNVPMINSLVFYIGLAGITQSIPVNQGVPIEIFQHLLQELDTHGRYLFLSAIANQLRYPNSHTHYFSCVLLYLFAENSKEIVKEQITRVLLERLIVNRPHPWGLLITFIELIKNPRYNFWNHSFTRCATDIERLFESVSRSINQI